MSFGSVITRLRIEKNMYQKELAAYLNVTISTISNYETDRHFPDKDTLCKIADFYGVTTDYLLERNSFLYNPEILSRPFVDKYTISDFINITLDFSLPHRHSLLEYTKLLQLDQQTQVSKK